MFPRACMLVLLAGCGARSGLVIDQASDAEVSSPDAGTDAFVPPPPPNYCDNPGLQAGSPWPMFGMCETHAARSPFAGPRTAQIAWRFEMTLDNPGWIAAPSVAIAADGTIYVSGVDRSLHALDPDGSERWSLRLGQSPVQPAIGADG